MRQLYFIFVILELFYINTYACTPPADGEDYDSNCEYSPSPKPDINIGDGGDISITNNATVEWTINSYIIQGWTIVFTTDYGELTIDEGATLIINGDLNIGDFGVLTVNGTLIVNGDVKSNRNFSLGGQDRFIVGSNGTVSISGVLDLNGDSNAVDDGIKGSIEDGGKVSAVGGISGIGSITDPGDSLPVELTYFQANLENSNIKLEWQTASEQNASHFDVQRSSDRKTWETLETISAAGNSQTAINYDYIDEEPLERGYYRLLQVDLDGASEIFGPIQVVQEGVKIPLELVIMPNELASGENVQFGISGLTEGAGINIQIFNGFGSLVYQENLENNSSKSLLKQMDFTDRLGTGIYYVVLTSGKKQVKEKLLIR